MGLKVVDVSNPYAPVLVASNNSYYWPVYATTIRVVPGYAFLADKEGGMLDLRYLEALPRRCSRLATMHLPTPRASPWPAAMPFSPPDKTSLPIR